MKPDSYLVSKPRIFLMSVLASFGVLVVSLAAQWLIYSDWLHRTGPLRIVGTSIAVLLAFFFALRWQLAYRAQALEMIHRFEMIARMNDRVRNSLQAIEYAAFLTRPDVADSVKEEVEAIDRVLREVLADAGSPVQDTEAVGSTDLPCDLINRSASQQVRNVFK